MQFPIKSIFFKVLVSFLSIVFFTLIISTYIEYYNYASELPKLFTEIRTKTIAQHLSASYTRDNGWNNLNMEILRINNLESLNTIDEVSLRIIVRDQDNRTIYNSFLNLKDIKNIVLVEGKSQPVTDFKTSEQVGLVTVYISRDYLREHTKAYLRELLKSGMFKGLITALGALVLSILLSRRITRPLILLTDAVLNVKNREEGNRVSITSSDEIGRLSAVFNSMLMSLEVEKKMRKQLLSDISHEINTPLNAMRLEARGLSDGLVSKEEACRYIIGEIDSLRNIIYDLDWLAETDSGAYSLNKEDCDILKLVNDEIKRWTHKARASGNKLVVEVLQASFPLVSLDLIRINTVLSNLIDNAIKYSSQNGSIRVKVSSDNSQLIISVCDSGPAIEPGHRSLIFERFYRTGGSPGSEVPGRGLGLAIVKQIIELHEGRLWLECGEKQGNCFSFSLPLKTGEQDVQPVI
jgi:histidine kinase